MVPHLAGVREQQRETMFQAEEIANADAEKCEEHISLGIGRMKRYGDQDRELRLETMKEAGRFLEARNSWGKIPFPLGKCKCLGEASEL